MAVTIKDIDLGKKEVSLGEFLSLILGKYENIEDDLFEKIMEQENNEEIVDRNYFDDYLLKRNLGK